MKNSKLFLLIILIFIVPTAFACAESGEDGSEALDCGEFGSAHNGHCHCSEGYAIHDETCVPFAEITELCEAHDAHEEGETDDTDDTDDTEHHHDATCLCQDATLCDCEGLLTPYGGNTYCEPKLHE